MTHKNKAGILGVIWVLALAACATSVRGLAAEVDSTRGWYGGGSLGPSRSTTNDGHITSTLQAAGFATSAVNSSDESGTAYKLFAGYRYNKNFALEGGYFDLGAFNFVATTAGPSGTLAGSSRPRGLNLDAVGTMPIASNFSAIGRVGAVSVDPNESYSGSGSVGIVLNPNSGKSGLSYKLGVGLQYDFTKSLGLRGEVERYRVDDTFNGRHDIDVYSAGLVFKFH